MNNQKGIQNKPPLKEFNATPIDTPTPISLDDNQTTTEIQTKPDTDTKDSLNLQTPLESPTELLTETETKLESVPSMPLETETQPSLDPKAKLSSEPVIEPEQKIEEKPNIPTTPQPGDISENPQDIKQKIEEVLAYNSADSVANSKSDKPATSRILKTLFTLSLIIFITVFAALAYFYFNPTPKTNPGSTTQPTETPTQSSIPTQSDVVCELNGFTYNLNQSFPSADGCNQCTCVSADNIVCTEKSCADVTVTPTTKSATITPIISTGSSTKKITPTIIEIEDID